MAVLSVIVACALGGCGDEAGDDLPPPPASVEAREGTHAILVGCTEYPALREELGPERAGYYDAKVRLQGCENDVAFLAETLRDYLGVPEANIQRFAGFDPAHPARNPTRDNIFGALDGLAARIQPGERVVFLFAGHGSQQPDEDGEELDRLDEILLAADARGWKGRAGKVSGAITDDEIHARFRAIADKGATVFAVFDCCHSGTASRDPTIRARELPAGTLAPRGWTPPPPLFRESGGPPRDLAGIVALYAVAGHQIAPELRLPRDADPADQRVNGLLSWHLNRTIRRHGGGITFRTLLEHITAAYEAMPYASASPGAEGALDLFVARDGRSREPPITLRWESGAWRLDAGSLQGLAVGTVLSAWPPGRVGEADASLGRVRLTGCSPVASVGEAVDELRAAKRGDLRYAVRIEAHGVGRVALPLAVVDAEGRPSDDVPPALEAVLAAPGNRTRFPVLDATRADEAAWTLEAVDGGFLLRRREAGAAPVLFSAAADLHASLRGLLRTERLRRLPGSPIASALPQGLRAELHWYASRPARSDLATSGRRHTERADVTPGSWMAIRLQNATGVPHDVGVLSIDAAQGIGAIFPAKGETSRLDFTENAEMWIGPYPIGDDALGMESLIVLAIPNPQRRAAYDFTHLTQPPLVQAREPGGSSAEARQLLLGVTGQGLVPRSVEVGGPRVHVGAHNWTTSYDRLGITDELRAVAHAVPAAQQHAAVAGEPTQAPDVHYLGPMAALLPADGDRPAAFATFDPEARRLQVHIDHPGGNARFPDGYAACLAAAEAGTLGGALVFRVEPTMRMAWWQVDAQRVADRATREEPGQACRLYERGASSRTTHQAWLGTAPLAADQQGPAAWRTRLPILAVLRAFRVTRPGDR